MLWYVMVKQFLVYCFGCKEKRGEGRLKSEGGLINVMLLKGGFERGRGLIEDQVPVFGWMDFHLTRVSY